MFVTSLAIAISTLSLFVALVVFVRNKRSAVNIGYLSVILCAVAWTLCVDAQAIVDAEALSLFLLRASFAAVVMLGFVMWAFVGALSGVRANGRTQLSMAGLAVAGVALSFSDWVISATTLEPWGASIPERGALYIAVVAIIVYLFGATIRLIAKGWQAARGRRRFQLRVVGVGLYIGFGAGVVTNAILPNLTGNTYPSRFAFIAPAVWTVAFAYAIVRHHLLDIRLAAIRTLAYSLALGTLGAVYVAMAMIVSSEIFVSGNQGRINQIVILFMLGCAMTFHPLRLFFDRITRRVFYQDGYDPQEVINQISSMLASTVVLHQVLEKGASILHSSIKPSFVHLRTVGGHDQSVTVGEPSLARGAIPESVWRDKAKTVWSVDEMMDGDGSRRALERLQRHGVAVCVRLQTSDRVIGLLVIGGKMSGNGYTGSEIEMLKTAADELAVGIQNSLHFREIEEFNATLQTKIDKATTKLRQSNQKLRLLDASKDEFISMASHQLRTPLTSMKGYLSMVLDGDAGEVPPAQRRMLEEAYDATQRMVYLIGDFLNVSRLQTGKFELERSSVNLATLIRSEIDQLRGSAESRQVVLEYDAPHDFPVLMLDENKIRQVMMNFIDNAIYYSKAGQGRVVITLTHHSKYVEFRVTDNGIGVPAGERAKLFAKFYRASNARVARPDGTGIGLFMSKKAIASHGGAIIFESQEGKGSVFGFRLPMDAPKI